MDRAFDRAPFASSRLRGRVVGAPQLDNVAISILDDLLALDDVGVFQTNLSVWFEAEELLRSVLHKVVALDVEFSRERNLAGGSLRLGRVERAVEPLHLARLPVGEGDLQRFLNDHIPVGPCVKILAHTPFQKLDVHHLVTL